MDPTAHVNAPIAKPEVADSFDRNAKRSNDWDSDLRRDHERMREVRANQQFRSDEPEVELQRKEEWEQRRERFEFEVLDSKQQSPTPRPY